MGGAIVPTPESQASFRPLSEDMRMPVVFLQVDLLDLFGIRFNITSDY